MEVQITNFRSIKQESYKFDHGITLLKGPSGQGKTTIFESIKWCLYGNSKNVYPITGKNTKQEITKVCLKFDDYTLTRTKPPEMLQLTHKDLNLEGDEAEEYIQNYIGNRNLWSCASYVSQGERNTLMSLSNNDKMLLIKEMIFGKEEQVIESYKKKLTTYQSKVETSINLQQGKLSYSNVLMDENSQVCENFEKVKKYEKAYLNKQKLESNYTQICESLIKDKEKEQINKSINQMKQDLEESQKILETYKYKLNPIIVSKYKKYKESKKFLENEPNYTYNPENNLEDLIQTKNCVLHNQTIPDEDPEVVKQNIEKIRAYNNYKTLKNNYDVYESKVDKLETYSLQLEKSRDSINQIRLKIYNLLNIENLSNIDNIICNFKNHHFNCPKCNTNLTIKNNTLHVNNIVLTENEKKFVIEGVFKIKNFENNIQICEEKLDTLKSLLNQIVEPEKVEKPENTNLENLENLLQLLKSKAEVNVTLEEANILIKECKMSEQRRKHMSIVEQNNMECFIDFPEDIDTYYQKYIMYSEKFNYASNFLEKNSYNQEINIEKYENLKSKIEVNLENAKQYEEAKIKYDNYIILKNKHLSIQEELFGVEKKKEASLNIENILNNCTNETLEGLLVQLNNTLNEIMDEFFENAFLEIKMFKKVNKVYKPKFSFSIQINNINYDNMNLLSGGEKDRVSIALTLALSKHFNFPFIMFDECMSSLDSELREKCLEIIKKYASEKIILNICHETIEGYYDNVMCI
jgi:DNA repair exonuclease SbcCD ATPase subunit